jgi:hypothetical protein
MKLNPCRKCRGAARPCVWKRWKACFVGCEDCDNATRVEHTEAQAVEAWNRENPNEKGQP